MNGRVAMASQLDEYHKKATGLHTLEGGILWYVNYIVIKSTWRLDGGALYSKKASCEGVSLQRSEIPSSLPSPGLILLGVGGYFEGSRTSPGISTAPCYIVKCFMHTPHMMSGTSITNRSPDSPPHLFLKTGRSPGNRAGTERLC